MNKLMTNTTRLHRQFACNSR